MKNEKIKKLGNILNFSVPLLFILLLFVFILCDNGNIKYDIMFSEIPFEDNVVIDTTVVGKLNKNTIIWDNPIRKNLYDGREIKIYNYKGYKFYAYVDKAISQSELLSMGINEQVDIYVPVVFNEEEYKDKTLIKRNYIESNINVYKVDVFNEIQNINNNFICIFIKSYFIYICSGNVIVLILSACLGTLFVDIIKLFVIKLFMLLSSIKIKK